MNSLTLIYISRLVCQNTQCQPSSGQWRKALLVGGISGFPLLAGNLAPALRLLNYSQKLEKAREDEHLLLFVLDDCSCSNRKPSFGNLKGKGRLLVQLLQSFTYLDVHLAVVTQHTFESTSADNGEGGGGNIIDWVFDVGHWTDASNRPVEWKNLKVDVLDKLVGESEQLLEPPNVCPTKTWKDESNKGLTVRRYQQVVLVIWPKKETDRIYRQYGFHALMDRIGSHSSATEPGQQKSSQLNLAEDLKLVVGFCRTQPIATWNQPEKRPELIHRLLRVCI